MTDKAYIVANKQQELRVLNNFEEKGFRWRTGDNPTSFVPSGEFNFKENIFPYMLMIANDKISWSVMKELKDKTIVYDGRKEENMYKVTQEFMNELIDWRDHWNLDAKTGMVYAFVDGHDIQNICGVVDDWLTGDSDPVESNNRLIAIIQWLNGEDVFEIKEPHKFIVRSDVTDEDGDYWYVNMHRGMFRVWYQFGNATRFNTREEAQEWANSHQVVVEIDAEGNEVEE